MNVGIACSAGSYKGVFVHGVLDAFEEAGVKADMYAASSSSVGAAAIAAIGKLQSIHGPTHWKKMYSRYLESSYDVSISIMHSLPQVM